MTRNHTPNSHLWKLLSYSVVADKDTNLQQFVVSNSVFAGHMQNNSWVVWREQRNLMTDDAQSLPAVFFGQETT